MKLDGTYRVPAFGGFNVSAVYRYTTGLAWGRTATIRGLAQGNETVRIEPRGTRRTDPINNLDFRVEKTFPLGSAARQFGIYLDLFNINNQGVIDTRSRTGVIEASGTTFGQPEQLDQPAHRTARIQVYVLEGRKAGRADRPSCFLPSCLRIPGFLPPVPAL